MTDEEKARELTIKNVTDGKNKYFSWGFYKGCVVGLKYNNKQIAELEKENAELKEQVENRNCSNCRRSKAGCPNDGSCHNFSLWQPFINPELTKAKEIIKDYLTIVKGAHTTVCGVPEENRTIYVLKLNEEAEQFLKESE